MAVVKHVNLKSTSVNTRVGPVKLDEQGQARVNDADAQQLVSLYGKAFSVVAEEKAAQKPAAVAPVTVDEQPNMEQQISDVVSGKTRRTRASSESEPGKRARLR